MDSREAAKHVAEVAIQNMMDEWGILMELLDSYYGDDFFDLNEEEQEDFAVDVVDELELLRQRVIDER